MWCTRKRETLTLEALYPFGFQFYSFDQKEFFYVSPPSFWYMAAEGYVYVPTACVSGISKSFNHNHWESTTCNHAKSLCFTRNYTVIRWGDGIHGQVGKVLEPEGSGFNKKTLAMFFVPLSKVLYPACRCLPSSINGCLVGQWRNWAGWGRASKKQLTCMLPRVQWTGPVISG